MGKTEVFDIQIERLKGLQERCEKLQTVSETAVKRTVSDFKTRAPGWVSTAVTQVYAIKKADIKKSLKVRKSKDGSTATIGGITVDNVELVYSGRLLTLTHFSQKPSSIPTKRATGTRRIPGQNIKSDKGVGSVAMVNPIAPYQVTATIFKGNRIKIDDAFVAPGKGGVILAFQRTGEDRTPIEVVKRTSIPQMITNGAVEGEIYERIDAGMKGRFEHHLEQALKNI